MLKSGATIFSNKSARQQRELEALLREEGAADEKTYVGSSKSRQRGNGGTICPRSDPDYSESVEVQATERDARLVMAQITNPEVPDCVAAAYAELGGAALSTGAITEGAEIGEVTASRLAVGSAGDATQAIRVVIPVISGETTAQLTVDRVFTRAGRSFATIMFEGRVEATPVETIDEITAVAASSLPA